MAKVVPVWTAGMMRLAYTLMAEATEAGDQWVAYQLHNSPVMVACRMVRGTCEIRIAKPTREHSDTWTRELEAMEKFLGVAGWYKSTDAHAKGWAIVYVAP